MQTPFWTPISDELNRKVKNRMLNSWKTWLAVSWLVLSNALSVNEWSFFKWCWEWHHWHSLSILQNDIGSVAHQPFSFKRDYFRAHFVIHFRCNTKLHSLSSLRYPIGQEILHMKNLESNWNQSLNKNKRAVLRFPTTHLWGQNRNGGSMFVPVTFHNNSVLHTTKHFRRSSSGAGRHWII